jgi:hypothetical protein
MAGVNHFPLRGFLAHDFDVVLDARPVGYAIHQAGHVAHVSDRLEFFVTFQFLDQCAGDTNPSTEREAQKIAAPLQRHSGIPASA